MKKVLWAIAGFSGAAAGFPIFMPQRTPPVELLAHRLEDTWADHHIVVETT